MGINPISRPINVGRFAPSPTGPLHIGSLVAAVGSYAMAKRDGGRWLLRIEDLDTARVVPGCADDIMQTLEALGFEWDGEVLWQSRRSDLYQSALERLQAMGMVYPCGCSRGEIARVSTAPHDGEGEMIYPGSCRNGLPPGKAPRAYRVRVGREPVVYRDLLLGDLSCDMETACGDFVVKRADGLFAYQLAVVVDDAEQGVNQVVRGRDLLNSTPRQIVLQRLLSMRTPVYCHLPLVTAEDGSKLSKRDNPVSLNLNLIRGFFGGKLVYDALRFLGQNPPQEMVGASGRQLLDWSTANFDLSLIPSSRPFTLMQEVSIR